MADCKRVMVLNNLTNPTVDRDESDETDREPHVEMEYMTKTYRTPVVKIKHL